jgi:outer membrane receptor for Fe3+-dicitrate
MKLSDNWYSKDAIEHSGWNKLRGVSSLSIHNKSARLVWQPDFEHKDRFQLACYVYPGSSQWKVKNICTVQKNEWFSFSIDYSDNGWKFNVVTEHGSFNKFIRGIKPRIFIQAFPYFGGQSRAPKDMKFYEKS